MKQLNSRGTTSVLMIAHIAGVIDLVALPVWIGALMQHYGYSAQSAGLTVTFFLSAVALTSAVVSPLFDRLPHRLVAVLGYAFAAAIFYVISRQAAGSADMGSMGLLHAIAGVGIGCGLSMVDGAMGRTANPHRMFAWANGLLGVVAMVFLGTMPLVIQTHGGALLFLAFAAMQLVAMGVVLLGFPTIAREPAAARQQKAKIPMPAWFAILAVVFVTMNQSMIFGFIERVGMERGFGAERVGGVLLAMGLMNLLPAPLAALLEKRLSPTVVAMCAPVLQAALALVIMNSLDLGPYAVACSFFVAGVLFAHIFLFGLIARLDPSGRAAASTPAMMMFGSAVGPALGGAVVQGMGYSGLGSVAVAISLLVVVCAFLSRRSARPVLAVT